MDVLGYGVQAGSLAGLTRSPFLEGRCMQVLVAEDAPVTRHLLQVTLTSWGYDVVVTQDGHTAWAALQQEDAPPIALLDWMMPGTDGIDLCQKIRHTERLQSLYVILLTSRQEKADMIRGLHAGADDYVTKPFDPAELRARLRVGERIIGLQAALTERVKQLEDALTRVKHLEGCLPICSYCKKIRDDQDYWHHVETYITEHSNAQFTHGVCPECYERILKSEMEDPLSEPGSASLPDPSA
jgi:CheY-like chemotaxis protein